MCAPRYANTGRSSADTRRVRDIRFQRALAIVATAAALLGVVAACGSGELTQISPQKARDRVALLHADSQRWTANWPGVGAAVDDWPPCLDSTPPTVQVTLQQTSPDSAALNALPDRLRADGWTVDGSLEALRGQRRLEDGQMASLGSSRGSTGVLGVTLQHGGGMCQP